MIRAHVAVRGAVQGVGFRPFVYRLATDLGLAGYVSNTPQGVFLEVEGDPERVTTFLSHLKAEHPPRAFIQSLETAFLDPASYRTFEIRESSADGPVTAIVLPDVATCPECLAELFDPTNRRYRYPFTNCTNCGPRFSIIERLPYDRPNTTMRRFQQCPECLAEYHDPRDRRFHAQPNACPVCGPALRLLDATGRVLRERDDALTDTIDRIRNGEIVAVKGLGGFHLLVDAANDPAVRRLRERKRREEKPLALMVPDTASAQAVAAVTDQELGMLTAPEAPIVLVTGRKGAVAPSVAPGNPYLGILLPYTPLHHLILHALGTPVVATSGNLSDEPICIDEDEAVQRLGKIADVLLVHNRPIFRHVDDSIVRVMAGRSMVLRRARGYAPLPVSVRAELPPVIAVGAHLKSTVAAAKGRDVFISQHLGDLETEPALQAFRRELEGLRTLFDVRPASVVSDTHPEYLSSKEAEAMNLPRVTVQHHFAHVRSCMAENELEGRVLGVSWDGTGLGTDGTIWGGEFLLAAEGTYRRVASFRLFPLPGGDAAIREPRRTALGLLYEILGDEVFRRTDLLPVRAFSDSELRVLQKALERKLNCPVTSSVGRLFDAVAALAGIRQRCAFEGQAAMELEFCAGTGSPNGNYPWTLGPADLRIDWEPLVRAVIADVAAGVPAGDIAARFHNTLAGMIVEVAVRAGEHRVVLTGGCFQNRYLCEASVAQLHAAGFAPYWHQRVPPNDGGIALGQILAAADVIGRSVPPQKEQ